MMLMILTRFVYKYCYSRLFIRFQKHVYSNLLKIATHWVFEMAVFSKISQIFFTQGNTLSAAVRH